MHLIPTQPLPVKRAYVVEMPVGLLEHFLETIEEMLTRSPLTGYTNPFQFRNVEGVITDMSNLTRIDYFRYMLIGYFEKVYGFKYCRTPYHYKPGEIYALTDFDELDHHLDNFIHYPIADDFGPYFDLTLYDRRTIELREEFYYDHHSTLDHPAIPHQPRTAWL